MRVRIKLPFCLAESGCIGTHHIQICHKLLYILNIFMYMKETRKETKQSEYII